jgi:hypothetical protein
MSRQVADCENQLVVVNDEDNPESPGTYPQSAPGGLLDYLLVGRDFWLDRCRHWFFSWLGWQRGAVCYIVGIIVQAECLPGSVKSSLSVTMMVFVGAGRDGES